MAVGMGSIPSSVTFRLCDLEQWLSFKRFHLAVLICKTRASWRFYQEWREKALFKLEASLLSGLPMRPGGGPREPSQSVLPLKGTHSPDALGWVMASARSEKGAHTVQSFSLAKGILLRWDLETWLTRASSEILLKYSVVQPEPFFWSPRLVSPCGEDSYF